MKKIYILLLIATFSLNLFCQQDNVIVLDSTYMYLWDSNTNDWVWDGCRFYTYDANRNNTVTSSFWGGVWRNRYVYAYDDYGNQTEKAYYVWDSKTNDWVGSYRSVYTYDANGNETEFISYEWDTIAYDWINIRHSVYTYDANGNQTERSSYSWDSLTNEWVGDSRTTYAFNADGNQTKRKLYSWDLTTNDWKVWERDVYEYDANGNQTEYIVYCCNCSLLDGEIPNYKEVSYWSELTTSISQNLIDLNFSVYPNPFTDYATIKLSDAVQTQKIELIDIHGRTVRTINNVNSNSATIHRENLPSGMYFIRIHSDATYVKKVIIR